MGTVTNLSKKGQVTLPKSVREALGLKPFDRIEFDVVGREVRLRKARLSIDELVGILPPLANSMEPEEMIRLAEDERAANWREKFG